MKKRDPVTHVLFIEHLAKEKVVFAFSGFFLV